MSEDEFYDSELRPFRNRLKGYQARRKDELKVQEVLLLEAACVIVNHNGFMPRGKSINPSMFLPELKGRKPGLSREERDFHNRAIDSIKWATGREA